MLKNMKSLTTSSIGEYNTYIICRNALLNHGGAYFILDILEGALKRGLVMKGACSKTQLLVQRKLCFSTIYNDEQLLEKSAL